MSLKIISYSPAFTCSSADTVALDSSSLLEIKMAEVKHEIPHYCKILFGNSKPRDNWTLQQLWCPTDTLTPSPPSSLSSKTSFRAFLCFYHSWLISAECLCPLLPSSFSCTKFTGRERELKQEEKTEILAHPASRRQGRHENHPENSSLHNLSSASLRNSPVIKLFLDLLEVIKKHLCKQKQDLSADCFISVENLLGMDPNWLLHNLVLTLAAHMERSPEAEPLLLLQTQNSFQGLRGWGHSEGI